MSRTTITNFFNRKPVDAVTFKKICRLLGLNPEKVAGKPQPEHITPPKKNDDQIDQLVQQVRSRCCDKILREHSKMRLLTREEVEVDQLYVDVWVLERISADVYTTIPRLLQHFDAHRDRLCLGRQVERRDGEQVAEQFSRLLVLGKPGAGKTTFLKHLAINCCQEKFFGGLIPVFLELRSIQTDSFDLAHAIQQDLELGNQQQTESLLKHGKALIFLDGLDEVSSQWRRQVQNQIRDFSKKYDQNRFILTCRTQIIECPPENFERVEVADFKPEQVKQLVEHWFLAKTSTQGAETAEKLLKQLDNNKPIQEIAVTPILLSLTCCFFRDAGELPAQRSQLYRRGLNQLLREWDRGRDIQREVGNEVYRQLTVSQKEQLLSAIAAYKFGQADNFVLFDQPEISRCIANHLNLTPEDGEAVLEAIEAQHGLLIERANEIWSFSHFTFQEYFTAYYHTQFQDLPVLASHVMDSRWREVFLLAVQMLQPAEALLRLMKQQIDQALAGNRKLQEFLSWVQEKSISVQATYKPAAVRAFYFDLAIDFDLEPDLFSSFATDLDSEVDLANHLAVELELDFYLSSNLNSTNPLIFGLADVLDLSKDLSDYKLHQKLQGLREKLEKGHSQDFQPWEESHDYTVWATQLQDIMLDCRNIGHRWQFSNEAEQLLKRYYETNKFLVECLKSSYPEDDPVRQEIESTLLLPISEIEQP